MNKITSWFLRAKHWQIFIAFAAVCLISSIVAAGSDLPKVRSLSDVGKADLLNLGLTMVIMLLLIGWFWSMGLFLNSIVKPQLKLGTKFLGFALIFPAAYVPVFFAVFFTANAALLVLILPFHFLAMYCLFYGLYFVSKSLVMAETGKQATFYDYAGPFFLIWFFPIGVWFTQPRINRLYAEQTSLQDPG